MASYRMRSMQDGKFEAQLLQLNNKLYCVDCFNVVKAKEQSQ